MLYRAFFILLDTCAATENLSLLRDISVCVPKPECEKAITGSKIIPDLVFYASIRDLPIFSLTSKSCTMAGTFFHQVPAKGPVFVNWKKHSRTRGTVYKQVVVARSPRKKTLHASPTDGISPTNNDGEHVGDEPNSMKSQVPRKGKVSQDCLGSHITIQLTSLHCSRRMIFYGSIFQDVMSTSPQY